MHADIYVLSIVNQYQLMKWIYFYEHKAGQNKGSMECWAERGRGRKKKGEGIGGSKKIYSGVNTAVKRPSFDYGARLFSDINIFRRFT